MNPILSTLPRACSFIRSITCLLVMCFVLCGCAKSFDDDKALQTFQHMSERELYNASLKALEKRDYSNATKRLEAFETLYPFSPHIKETQRYTIYSCYQQGDYVQASADAERYIHLYPQDKFVDYAYYMKAMANFEQQRGILANMFHLNESKRDPGSQKAAFSDFQHLVKRFPHSVYRQDAIKHLVYIRNMFAQRELDIATFYYRRQRYVAALNRANQVIKNYPQSPQAITALKLAEATNKRLKFKQSAEEDSQVLQNNQV